MSRTHWQVECCLSSIPLTFHPFLPYAKYFVSEETPVVLLGTKAIQS